MNLKELMRETDTSEPLPEPPKGETAAGGNSRGWLSRAVEWIGELLERMFYRGAA